MFQANSTNEDSNNSTNETIIGSMVKITGSLTSDGDVRINGSLEEGEINAKGTVFVGEEGKVKANIKAKICVISGSVEGNIRASEGVEIGPSGKVDGEIASGGRLVIEAGGVFIGKSTMNESSKKEDDIEAEIEKDLDQPEEEEK
jgi:cytoskeletal protein CcmA (bactofilin family)